MQKLLVSLLKQIFVSFYLFIYYIMEKLHIFLEIKYTILKVNFAYIDKNNFFFFNLSEIKKKLHPWDELQSQKKRI